MSSRPPSAYKWPKPAKLKPPKKMRTYRSPSPRAHRTRKGPTIMDALASAWASDAATTHTDRLYKYWKYKIVLWLIVSIFAISLFAVSAALQK